MYISGDSSLFCMGNVISIISAEVDHRKGVSSSERSPLSKNPGFHQQDIS